MMLNASAAAGGVGGEEEDVDAIIALQEEELVQQELEYDGIAIDDDEDEEDDDEEMGGSAEDDEEEDGDDDDDDDDDDMDDGMDDAEEEEDDEDSAVPFSPIPADQDIIRQQQQQQQQQQHQQQEQEKTAAAANAASMRRRPSLLRRMLNKISGKGRRCSSERKKKRKPDVHAQVSESGEYEYETSRSKKPKCQTAIARSLRDLARVCRCPQAKPSNVLESAIRDVQTYEQQIALLETVCDKEAVKQQSRLGYEGSVSRSGVRYNSYAETSMSPRSSVTRGGQAVYDERHEDEVESKMQTGDDGVEVADVGAAANTTASTTNNVNNTSVTGRMQEHPINAANSAASTDASSAVLQEQQQQQPQHQPQQKPFLCPLCQHTSEECNCEEVMRKVRECHHGCQESEAKCREFIMSSSVPMMVASFGGLVVEVNDSMLRMLGLKTRMDMVGHKMCEHVTNTFAREACALFARIMKGQASVGQVRMQFVRKDKSLVNAATTFWVYARNDDKSPRLLACAINQTNDCTT
eukprot:TRINITY_DN66285_c7_g1_i1.p2 TRINITY_DN66285_c7_g1~~TRINITY_DN66285_c7_g1_i1.p2  ORF type:complete len:563 (-),score=320.52 TRINITY_DN66285_c7_g1_i1:477-2045(-)